MDAARPSGRSPREAPGVSSEKAPHIVGRYAVYDAIAAGGMATVHLGRSVGAAGFSRPVAIKRLHAQYARDPEFAAMFLDEARLAARVCHSNVVQMLDVVSDEDEILLVMEYVHGESFSYLLRAAKALGKRLPPRIVCNIVAGALQGLHAAHTATGEGDKPLCIVHRDVSPQNVLVGTDGVARVLDFGVAKAVGKLHTTREGQIKGKLRYMAPEQVRGAAVTPRTDLWATSVMLWEALTGRELFSGDNDAAVLHELLDKEIPSPRQIDPNLPEALAEVVLAGLERDPDRRISSALEMAVRLEKAVGLVPAREVGEWVKAAARAPLAAREKHMADLETIAAVPTVAPVNASGVQAVPPRAISRRAYAGGVAIALATACVIWLARRPDGSDVGGEGRAAGSPVEASAARHDEQTAASARLPPEAQPEAPPTATPAAVPSAEPSAVPEAPPTSRPSLQRPPPKQAPPPKPASSGYKVPLYGRD